MLGIPDFDRHFFFTTDASDASVGVLLSQQGGASKTHHIITCYLHRFTPTELRYPVGEKELYASWWGVK